jgi:hypothetical protein
MKYLSDYMQDAQSAAFEKYGAFFAVSDKQFEQQRKLGVRYTHMGANLICPSDNVTQLAEALEAIHQEAVWWDVKENGAEAIIEREYFNHEIQLTMDRSAMLMAITLHAKLFPEKFTAEVIDRVCAKCFNLACENDWF